MIDLEKQYYLKVDDPSKLYEINLLSVDGNNIEGKLKVRDGIYTKILLEHIEPEKIQYNNEYYILSINSNNITKVKVIETPDVSNNNVIPFKVNIFGETKPHSKGIVNVIISKDLNDTYIYKLTLEGRYNGS